MPNTTVMVMGEKPQAAWYTRYSGVGALELARKNKMIDASRLKAAVLLRVGAVNMGRPFLVTSYRQVVLFFDYDQTVLYSQAMSATNLGPSTRSEGSARDRLLAAADQLFYEEGGHTVRLDRVSGGGGGARALLA